MTEIKSRVKQGILKLRNLQNENNKEKSIKKLQGIKYQNDDNQQQRNPKPFKLLSDADLHVKALLSNMLMTIDAEDQDNLEVQSKLKQINQIKNKRHSIKLIDHSDKESDEEDEECHWGKSKTRISSKKAKQSSNNLSRKNTHINGFRRAYTKNKGNLLKIPSINAIRMGSMGMEFKEQSNSSTVYLQNENLLDSSDLEDSIHNKGDSSIILNDSKQHLNNRIGDHSSSINNNNSHSCTNKNSKDILFRSVKTFKKESRNSFDIKALTHSNRKDNSPTGKKYFKEGIRLIHKKPSAVLLEKPPNSDRLKKSIIIEDKDNVDETDIRNILPLSKENFNDYLGICSKIGSSICLQPKKETDMKASTKSIVNKKTFTVHTDDEEEEENEENIKTHEMRYRKISHAPLVYDSNSDEESDDEITETYYLAPTSPTRIIYDCLLIIMILYSSFSIPFSLAFELNKIRTVTFDFIMNVFIDCFFACDIILSFFTAFFDYDEDLIKDFGSIAVHYLSQWFWIDLLSCFPYFSLIEFYCIYYPKSSLAVSTKNIFNSSSLTLVNLIKLFRLIKAFKIFHYNAFINFVKQILVERNLVSKWFRLYMTLLLFIISCHLMACVFIFFGFNYYPNWIVDQDLDPKDQGDIYTASLYFIFLTIYSVGYGDITSINIPERVFNLFLLIVGIVIYSWTVSSLSRYYVDGDEKSLEFRRKYDLLQNMKINYEKMPMELFEKIQRFLLYQKNTDKIDTNDILDDLPIGLKNNLITEMYKPIIENFVFFKNFDSNDFKIKVILALKPLIGLKNERLVNDGDVMEEIFFVKAGRLVLEFPLPIVLSPELAKALNKTSLSINPAGTIQEQITLAIAKSTNYTLDDFDLQKQKDARLNSFNNPSINPNSMSEIRQQYVKIIDICRNEHFGDVLMFLNQRSPLRVKVKSKRAELFILKKSDAFDISSSYDKIWQKIIKKSLFNMQQINRLINKSLKFFFRHYEGKSKGRFTHEGDTLTKGVKNSYFKHTATMNGILNIKEDELQSIPSEHRSLIGGNEHLAPINEVESRKDSTSQLGNVAKLIPCSLDDHSENSTQRRKSLISNTNSSTRTLTANVCNHNVSFNNNNNKKKSSSNIMMPSDLSLPVIKKDKKRYHLKNDKNAAVAADNSSILFYKENDINSEYYPNETDIKDNIFYCEDDINNIQLYNIENEPAKTIHNNDPNVNGDNNTQDILNKLTGHEHKNTDSIIFNYKERNICQHPPIIKEECNSISYNNNNKKNHEDSEVFMSKLRLATQINPLFTSVKNTSKISAQMSDKTLKILNHKFPTHTIVQCNDIIFSLESIKDKESDHDNDNENESIDKLQSQLSHPKRYNRRSIDEKTIDNTKSIGVHLNSNNNKQIQQQSVYQTQTAKFGATVMCPIFSPAILGEPISVKPRRQSVVVGLQKKDSLFTPSINANNNLRKENKEKKLNLISENIKNNAQIMKYPDAFYSELFTQVMGKEKVRDETKGLNKRLNDVMKIIEEFENDEKQQRLLDGK